jgi:hypothetical protein
MADECTHGVTFDEVEAKRLLSETKEQSSGDPAVDFVMGPTNATAIIQKRWPRGWFTEEKPCPSCGFVGIAYASYAHYLYGDW